MTQFQVFNRSEHLASWHAVLRRAFGILWIIAGLLKLQPGMFSAGLVDNVVGPNATDGQPAWLFHLMMSGVNLWHAGLPLTAILLAVWEIALGVGLIAARGRWFRITLWCVIGWSAVVWVMAEGMGGVLTGSPSFAEDAPGSTPFYVLGALLLLYPEWVNRTLPRWAGGFWAAAAVVQALPYNWSSSTMAGIFGNVTMMGQEPVAIVRLNNAFIMAAFRDPAIFNVVMIGVMAVLAWGYWTERINGPIWWLTIAWLAFLWVVPQALATLFTGTATDLGNEFPLLILLWLAKQQSQMSLPAVVASSHGALQESKLQPRP